MALTSTGNLDKNCNWKHTVSTTVTVSKFIEWYLNWKLQFSHCNCFLLLIGCHIMKIRILYPKWGLRDFPSTNNQMCDSERKSFNHYNYRHWKYFCLGNLNTTPENISFHYCKQSFIPSTLISLLQYQVLNQIYIYETPISVHDLHTKCISLVYICDKGTILANVSKTWMLVHWNIDDNLLQ